MYADNFKCVSGDPGVLQRAARFTTGYVRLVGQEPASSKYVLTSTSGTVRADMRGRIVTDEGDRWSVNLDVRDLGGHLDTTFRGSATLDTRDRLVIARLILIFALPLDVHGRPRVIRTMFIPGALHGIEASFLSETGLRKLRSALFWLYCLAGSLLPILVQYLVSMMVRQVAIRLFALFGSGFVCFVGNLVWMFIRCTGDNATDGCPGHGPMHLLVESAPEIGFPWDSHVLWWERPGLLFLTNIAGLNQHFRAAVFEAWRIKISADLCSRKGFRGSLFFDINGTLQLLNSNNVRER